MRLLRTGTLALALGGMAMAGCTEQPQTLRKADSKAWDAATSGHLAPGWKAGDQASWEEQMRVRAQAQNEYQRSAAAPK